MKMTPSLLALGGSLCLFGTACKTDETLVPLPTGEFVLAEALSGDGEETQFPEDVLDLGVTLTISDGTITLEQTDGPIVTSATELLDEDEWYEGCPIGVGSLDVSETYVITEDFDVGGVVFTSAFLYRQCEGGNIGITPRNTEDDLNPISCGGGVMPCLTFTDP
jgi:hypothetical protein